MVRAGADRDHAGQVRHLDRYRMRALVARAVSQLSESVIAPGPDSTVRLQRVAGVAPVPGGDGNDAAQTALVEILQSARTFGGRSSLERWADRITLRITLRHARDGMTRLDGTLGVGYARGMIKADLGYMLVYFLSATSVSGREGPEGTYHTLAHLLGLTLAVSWPGSSHGP